MHSAPSLERNDEPTTTAPAAGPDPTAPEPIPARHQRRSRAMRRAGMVAVGVVILLGVVNVLGPRLERVSTTAEGTSVTLTYATVTRPGLSTPWIVEVRRPGGFDGKLTVSTTADYFDGFDYNVLYPEPVATVSRGDLVAFVFARPPGEVFRVRLDARATPAWTFRRDAVTVVGGRGLPEVTLSYRTIFLP